MDDGKWKVLVYDNISETGLEHLSKERYQVDADSSDPDAILLRSRNLQEMKINSSLKAVGRAGAGVNNIPVQRLSEEGIPVFNTPGANANAVKELVVAGLLLSCRNVIQAWQYTESLSGTPEEISAAVEAGKKKYAGSELPGRTLGIIGLGAIGRSVADTALQLGMRVIGHDPMLTVEGAWRLPTEVARASSVAEVLANADFITFHVPLTDDTRYMINEHTISAIRPGATLLNFARAGIVEDSAVAKALSAGSLHAYTTDFPSPELIGTPGVIALPHLGASTVEAEENCARMVVEQIRDFLENGNIRNSVNFPAVMLPRGTSYRVVVTNANVPNMLGQISTAMAQGGLNIHDMINQSRNTLAYTVVDTDSPIAPDMVARLQAIDGVLHARIV